MYEGRDSGRAGTAPCPGLLAEPVSVKCFGGAKAPEVLLAPSLPRWLQGRALLSPIMSTSIQVDPAGCLIPKGSPALPTLLD